MRFEGEKEEKESVGGLLYYQHAAELPTSFVVLTLPQGCSANSPQYCMPRYCLTRYLLC